jgi:flagellar motor switch protein FliM
MSAAPETAPFQGRRSGEAFASAAASKARFPVLEDIYEQAAKRHADELRRLQSAAFFSFAGVDAGPLGDAVEGTEGSAVAALFRAAEWNAHVVVKMSRQFLLTMVEILFGGDGAEPAKTDERPFTGIEMRVAKAAAKQFAAALEAAFGAAAPAPDFRLERVESRLEFALPARRDDIAVSGKFRLKALGRGGLVLVIVPQAALDAAIGGAAPSESSARGRGDADWSRLIGAELRKSEVRLSAVLDERRIALGDVAGWQVGQVISLQAGPASLVRLVCNEAAIASCELGQADGAYTLRVAGAIEEQGFMDAILSR